MERKPQVMHNEQTSSVNNEAKKNKKTYLGYLFAQGSFQRRLHAVMQLQTFKAKL